MSSRGGRILRHVQAEPYHWGHEGTVPVVPAHSPVPKVDGAPQSDGPDRAECDRQAFATAYAQGEQAGFEAGRLRADAMLRRLGDTLEELAGARALLLQQAERQVLQVALAIARRILQREIHSDPDLLAAMARVALDRLGDVEAIRVRLNPDDHRAVGHRLSPPRAGTAISVEADPVVPRGGCLIESPLGFIDASLDAQFRVIQEALSTAAGFRGQEVQAHAS